MAMTKELTVDVTDGRFLRNTPDAIMFRAGDNDPIWVCADTWNKLTANALLPRRGSLRITADLYKALKSNANPDPEKTDNTARIKNNGNQDICTRCGGLGIIEAYKNTNGGICFDCNGKGVV